jgi:hypothetical protein
MIEFPNYNGESILSENQGEREDKEEMIKDKDFRT